MSTRLGSPRTAIIALVSLAATACTTTPEPIIKTIEVKTVVPVYCKAQVPDRSYPDTTSALRNAAGPEDRYLLMAAGRTIRLAVENELRTALRGCGGPASEPTR